MRKSYQSGLTLVELTLTLAVLSIAASIALPELNQLVVSNRNQAAMHELHALLQQARSQAVTRKRTLELCPSLDGLKCSSNWMHPRLLRVRSSGQPLSHTSAHAGSGELRWAGFSGSIRFYNTGISPISNGRFFICEEKVISQQLIINKQGRIRWGSKLENQQESTRC
ncbi:GspH/FimT family pseudopilin [uncultured Pseudomonas sp.]|uniref:GspH/FimT family pseudopilin n=1 Tax=uncultured Pseudomonas sp. TaxID=114707 RepID=UPI00262B2A19|nr:GspH/FimT family pseudopilin [uncultured Pseudomonas sp.]